jgi:alpha-glucuronidase
VEVITRKSFDQDNRVRRQMRETLYRIYKMFTGFSGFVATSPAERNPAINAKGCCTGFTRCLQDFQDS